MSGRQKVTVSTIVLLLVLGTWFFWPKGFDPDDVKNYPPDGRTVVAFGDSLVEGSGSERGGGFVTLLSQEVGIPIQNFGVPGDTTTAARTRLPDVLAADPDIVIVLLGGNDFLKRVPRSETEANLSAIIKALQESGAIVVLLGIQGGILSDGYDKMFENLADRYETAFVSNVLDDIIGEPNLMYDAIHPNDLGYTIIADRIAPILLELLPLFGN